jgi:LAO/AO transport system kinase
LKLLTQKAWQLISSYRMRDLDNNKLYHSLEQATKDPDFNIYRFAESVAEESGPQKSQ